MNRHNEIGPKAQAAMEQFMRIAQSAEQLANEVEYAKSKGQLGQDFANRLWDLQHAFRRNFAIYESVKNREDCPKQFSLSFNNCQRQIKKAEDSVLTLKKMP